MSRRLHTAKVYKIEYADNACFGNETETINNLINALTDGTWFNDEDYPEYSTELEVEKGEFLTMLDFLSDPENEDEYEEIVGEKFAEKYPMKEVHSELECLYEKSDPDNEYMKLSWF
jgi:hypothetical protein